MTRARYAAIVLLPLALGACAHLLDNLQVVEPGRFYRSGQMPGHRLESVIKRRRIQTVINLRGAHPEEDWYRRERAVCTALEVAHHDLDWSGGRLPAPDSLAQFITWCRQTEQPILVHCQGGVHRSGVAAACYLLGRGEDLDKARKELGIFFNDAPIGRVLDLYADSYLDFDVWLRHKYPSQYQALTQGR